MKHVNSLLKQIRNELDLTQAELGEKMGCGASNISMIETGKAALNEKHKWILIQILKINPDFLKTGRGPIRISAEEKAPGSGIPLYDLNKVEKLRLLLQPRPTVDPEGYISIPNLPQCDGATYHIGDTMSPVLRSGDMVLYRTLNDTSEIFWGDIYLIAYPTSAGEYISVCYLDKSETPGRAIMRGANPGRSDTEIELSKISAIAFVKATIRLNSAK